MKIRTILSLVALCLIAGLAHAATVQPELEVEAPAASLEGVLVVDLAAETEAEATAECKPDVDALDRALQPAFQVAVFDECLIDCYQTFLACKSTCGTNQACLNTCAYELERCRIRC